MKRWIKIITIIFISVWAVSVPVDVAAQNICGESETVVYGDTLREIAARCNTTVAAILEANPALANPDMILVGQQLDMPDPPEESDGSRTYLVQPDDTLYRIAQQFDTTVAELLDMNPQISNADFIYVGQQLQVPALPEPEPPGEVTISPTSGPPGTEVTVQAEGLPANIPAEIAVGRYRSEYDVSKSVRTNAEGELITQVTIPEFSDPDEKWVVVIIPEGDHSASIGSNVFTTTIPQSPGPTFEEVQIYLVALEEGEVGCGDELVAVERDIEPTPAPLTAAIEELLAMEERMLGQSGLYNALFRSDLQVEDVELEDGKATIILTGDLQTGGVCDEPRIEAQLRETALQFETVDEAEILVNGTPLEERLSSQGR